ncbi:MAG TPA: antibiotic biosynthesis monooxygenase family protein [Vicinamibacteria bacterium]|nr:antibiotic biosynthesis monooxygenase family protein [Vicinamibacteria bacterium]
MAVRQIATYQVKAAAVERVKAAIAEFVDYVEAHEPGTRLYMAWQERDDPTRFAHLFLFQDEAAHAAHGRSDAVKRFQAVYKPELVGAGRVVFTDYEAIAEKND